MIPKIDTLPSLQDPDRRETFFSGFRKSTHSEHVRIGEFFLKLDRLIAPHEKELEKLSQLKNFFLQSKSIPESLRPIMQDGQLRTLQRPIIVRSCAVSCLPVRNL